MVITVCWDQLIKINCKCLSIATKDIDDGAPATALLTLLHELQETYDHFLLSIL